MLPGASSIALSNYASVVPRRRAAGPCVAGCWATAEHGPTRPAAKPAVNVLPPRRLLLWSSAAALAALHPPLVSLAAAAPASAEEASATEFSTESFRIQVPAGFARELVPATVEPSSRGSTTGQAPQALPGFGPAPPPNPLKARFTSGSETISVAVRFAKDMRPTFLQVNDLSDFGEETDIQKLLVPNGSALLASSSFKAAAAKPGQGGAVPLERTYYLLEISRGDLHGYLAASAKFGQVFVMLAGSTGDWDDTVATRLRGVAQSFRVLG